jgi:hypothetical protein
MTNDTTPPFKDFDEAVTHAQKQMPDDDTAPCRKCETPISTSATRCPACGFDPSPGILATVGLLVFAPFALLGVFMALAAVGGAAVGAFAPGAAIGALFATAVLFGLPMYYCLWYAGRRRQRAGET